MPSTRRTSASQKLGMMSGFVCRRRRNICRRKGIPIRALPHEPRLGLCPHVARDKLPKRSPGTEGGRMGRGLWRLFSAGGLLLGTLFFAAALTPTLLPRNFVT